MASITMTLEEHAQQQRTVAALQKQISELKKLVDARPPEASDAPLFAMALQVAMPIVQFTVANLHPRDVRGWPFEELRKIAAALREPVVARYFRGAGEIAIAFEKFAETAEFWEKERAKGTEKQTFREMVAAQSVTPERVAEIFKPLSRLQPPPITLAPLELPASDQPATIEVFEEKKEQADPAVDNLATPE